MSDQKIIVLHGFKPDEALAAMRALKSALPAGGDTAFATTTDTNIDWKVGELIEHITEEHRRFREMPKKA
jgi:hypothetical protein